MMRLIVFLALLCAALFGVAGAQPARDPTARDPAIPAGMEAHTIAIGSKSGTQTRHFLVQAANVRPGAPIVVLLHGGSQSMREIFGPRAGASRLWRDIAQEQGFVLLAPNGTNARTGDTAGDDQNWADVRELSGDRGTDVQFILAMIDWALARYRADPRQVYVTGASNGGMMTYTLLIDAPERFAAGAAFIANLPAADGTLSEPSRPTPLLIMNGTKDPLMPYDGGAVAYNRGEVRSAPATAAWWAAANGAAKTGNAIHVPDGDPSDGCRIRGERHRALPNGAQVDFYTIEGGGHAMPTPHHPAKPSALAVRLLGPLCRDIESARLAWDFLSAHQR